MTLKAAVAAYVSKLPREPLGSAAYIALMPTVNGDRHAFEHYFDGCLDEALVAHGMANLDAAIEQLKQHGCVGGGARPPGSPLRRK